MIKKDSCIQQKQQTSKLRKTYSIRLIGRCIVFIFCILLYFYDIDTFSVVKSGNFFDRFSILHILWISWMIDMVFQLVPVKNHIALGSQKLFLQRFKPVKEKINYHALQTYIIKTTKSAYKVFSLWFVVILGFGALYCMDVLREEHLFLISVLFYVCDLICVLIWCPFRLMMGNRCCTTCRIFNWDHLMMFTPMLLVNSFYSISLLLMAFVVWVVWELCVMMYPERFWEKTNVSLRCSNCTDKLCTQYCGYTGLKKDTNRGNDYSTSSQQI